MSDIVGFNITPDSGTTLRKMLKHNLEPFLDKFEIISGSASKEHSLEKAMKKMVDDWDPVAFNLVAYRDSGTCWCHVNNHTRDRLNYDDIGTNRSGCYRLIYFYRCLHLEWC